ncbi:MAG: hypothetical protein J0L88_13440 [Xanthomonadales bacterium]|nr:hypothetical protein [Xanthomonadales bacterium]
MKRPLIWALSTALLGACQTAVRHAPDHVADAASAAALRRPDALARYLEAAAATNAASHGEWPQRAQRLAFAEAALGLYNEAVRHFPLTERADAPPDLPTSASHRTEPAADVVARLAETRRLVLVNEAHHDVATRRLTLSLLPRLRALGFSHFAVESLDPGDTGLQRRGHALESSGFYVDEAVFGEIIREALRLGFVPVAYEHRGADRSMAARERGQAEALARVLASDPAARVFVHAGYAHIDKGPGRLGNAEPMAAVLAALTGITPLSIDQTVLRSSGAGRESALATALIDAFSPIEPVALVALVARNGDQAWSARAQWHDVSVLLPRPGLDEGRPTWLDLDGARQAWPIDAGLCAGIIPCSVSAHRAGEPDAAVVADRYAFMEPAARSMLYLRPGRYRLVARDAAGVALAAPRSIEVRRTRDIGIDRDAGRALPSPASTPFPRRDP